MSTTTKPDIDLVSGEFWGRDPHDALTWMRRNEPVYFDERNGVWGISKYHDVKEISKNPAVFSNAGGIRPDSGPVPMMIDMDDPEHLRRRKLVNKGFTPKQIRDQEPKVRRVVDRIIDGVCERGECDFVTDVAAWLPLVMIADALGFEEKDHAALLEWSDDLLKGLGAPDPTAAERMMNAAALYHVYMTNVIEQRRAKPTDDLAGILVHSEVDGHRLDDEEIVMESLLILIGGDETTRHVISGGAYQLLTHRDQWDDLVRDRSLLPSAVEEMLRWVTPIKNMSRTVTRDVEVRGRQLREGQKLMLLYPSANRDEDVFADPFRFDIRRSPNEHVAFGFGTHFCLGNSLARLELNVMFDRLLDRLPDLQLATPDEPAFRQANFVSGYESMPVTFTPAKPLG